MVGRKKASQFSDRRFVPAILKLEVPHDVVETVIVFEAVAFPNPLESVLLHRRALITDRSLDYDPENRLQIIARRILTPWKTLHVLTGHVRQDPLGHRDFWGTSSVIAAASAARDGSDERLVLTILPINAAFGASAKMPSC